MSRPALLVACVVLAACSRTPAAGSSDAAPPPLPADAAPAASNIYGADYVGPAVCAECHADKHASWRGSLHASMNQRTGAAGAAVIGDFAGARLDYAGGTARFLRDAEGAPLMELTAAGAVAPRRYRVTRTIGTRYIQEYVGVDVDAPSAVEVRLPFGWWRRPFAGAGGWFPSPYFDSWYGPEYRADGRAAVDAFVADPAPWATRCAWCHNTFPFELRALRAAGESPLGHGLEQFFTLAPGARSPEARRALAVDNLLPTDELVTVGISCESCHLGGRAHATGGEAPRFVPYALELALRPGAPDLAGGRRDPAVVTRICAQCHSTPTLRWPSGAAQRNSSEALDFLRGACTSQASCISCHDPHVAGPGAGAPGDPRHLAACLGCHDWLRDLEAQRTHTRHAPQSASCLDCHMPRVVQGVSGFVRTHHIESPLPPASLAAGAPNACNLCHLDRSLGWTLDALAAGWGLRRAPPAGVDLRTPAGRLWLASSDGPTRLVAAAAYGRAPRELARAGLPTLLDLLASPVAYDRMFVLFAVEDALGRPIAREEFDPRAPPATRAAQLARLRARLRAP